MKCSLRRLHSLINLVFTTLIIPKQTHGQSKLSFCDGSNKYVIDQADCDGGITFGERKPDCVCISGIYRSWTETCEIYDGFTEEYCLILSGYNYDLQGFRLIPGIQDIYKDSVVVFGKNRSDFLDWTSYDIDTNGKSWSDTFYTLNGFPVMLTKANDKFICVEPAERIELQVCRYFARDNAEFWEPGVPVRILVQEDCKIPGYTMAELKEHRCYDILNNKTCKFLGFQIIYQILR